MAIIKFTNTQLCDEGSLSKGELYIDTISGKIISPLSVKSIDKIIDLQGLIIAPGFIDIQINGCYGFDFSHNKPRAQYLKGYNDCMKRLLSTGTTAICPTMVTSTPENYSKILPLLGNTPTKDQTESLGAHCEGPIISKKKKGCHEITNLKRPKSKEEFYQVYGGKQNLSNVKIITAAPEIDGILDIIPEIVENNVVYSIGHTESDFETSLKAVHQGATMLTHIFNAMPQPHHRNPGPIGLLGLEDTSKSPYFGCIADGIHIHPTYVRIIYETNREKCCFVTDAITPLGLPDGDYQWEKQVISKRGPLLKLKGTDTIAGSGAELAQCVRNAMEWCEISLPEAVKCVTNHPAKSIGFHKTKGFLRVGYDADLVILDKHGYVKAVYKLGNEVVNKTDQPTIRAHL